MYSYWCEFDAKHKFCLWRSFTSVGQPLIWQVIANLTNSDGKVNKVFTFAYVEYAQEDLSAVIQSLMLGHIILDDGNKLRYLNYFDDIYHDSDKSTIVIYIKDEVIPYLQKFLTHYSLKFMMNHIKLESKYAIMLFELFFNNIERKEVTLTLAEFKKLCDIENISAYQQYGNMKVRVLAFAVNEINNKTTLQIKYHELKKSRKIVAVSFDIAEKPMNIEKSAFTMVPNILA